MNFYGLQSNYFSQSNSLVTLENTSADVSITGFVAHLAITLIYRNSSSRTLEVTYSCPVDSKAAVYSFEAKLGGRTIIGHCVEKKKAENIYKEAVQHGSSAILGSENPHAGDIFHLALGNFPAGETAELKIKIVIELPVETDGCVTFTIPTVFTPRYSSTSLFTNFTPCHLSYSNGVSSVRSQYSLDVKAKVHGSLKISRITSEANPINVELSDDGLSAEITQNVKPFLDHDWSIKIYYHTPHQATALQMAGDRTGKGIMKDDVIMVNLFPEVPLEGYDPHKELIILIDRSGSMDGSRIEKAKDSLLFLLKSLPLGCLFNIISFGSNFSTLFDGSKRYSEETLNEALLLHKQMTADMGGTEILPVLKYIFSVEPTPEYPRQVIVLTDGAVWDQDQVFDLISSFAHEARVFSVGIGEGASTALVRGMAEAGRGRCEMVMREDQLQMKVMGLLASMLQNPIRCMKFEWEVEPPQSITIVPKVPRCLYGGQQLILFARSCPKTQVKSLKITWRVESKEVVCEIPERQVKVVHDSSYSFHRLAAKAQIKQWELEEKEKLRHMIELSVSSDVVCKATSFVGVDPVNEKIRSQFSFIPQISSNSSLPFSSKGLSTLNSNSQSGYDILKHPVSSFMKNTSQPQEFQHFGFGSSGSHNSQNEGSGLFGTVPINSSIASPVISKPQSQQTSPFAFGCSQSLFGFPTSSTVGNASQNFAIGAGKNSSSDKKETNNHASAPFVFSDVFSSLKNTSQPQKFHHFGFGSSGSHNSQNKDTCLFGSVPIKSSIASPVTSKSQSQQTSPFTFGCSQSIFKLRTSSAGNISQDIDIGAGKNSSWGKKETNNHVSDCLNTPSVFSDVFPSLKSTSQPQEFQHFKFGISGSHNSQNKETCLFGFVPKSPIASPVINKPQSQQTSPFSIFSFQSSVGNISQDAAIGDGKNSSSGKETNNPVSDSLNTPSVLSDVFPSLKSTSQPQEFQHFKFGSSGSHNSQINDTCFFGSVPIKSSIVSPVISKPQSHQTSLFTFGCSQSELVKNKEVAKNSGTKSFGAASTSTSSFGNTSQSQLNQQNQQFSFGSNQNQDLENKNGDKFDSNGVRSSPSSFKETLSSQKQFLSNFKSTDDALLKIVEAQLFNGSWTFESCLKFIPASQDNLRQIQSQISLDDTCFATAVTLAYIETSFSSKKQEWVLLHNKGKQFLQSKNVDALDVIKKCSNELQRLSAA